MGICIHEPTIAREMEYIATGKVVINVCLNILSDSSAHFIHYQRRHGGENTQKTLIIRPMVTLEVVCVCVCMTQELGRLRAILRAIILLCGISMLTCKHIYTVTLRHMSQHRVVM